MIRRFCFCFVLCLASLLTSGVASSQVLLGTGRMPSLHHTHPLVPPGRILPLARKFFTTDTIDFGAIPQGSYIYQTIDITNSSSTLAYFEPEPWSDADYNGLEMFTCTDDENVDGSVDPNTTSTVYYSIDVNPSWYAVKFPSGGEMRSRYAFYYTDYDLTKYYEKDPALLIANPLSFDTSGPTIMKLVHGKTQSLPMLLTDDTAGHIPVDVLHLDSMTEYFIIENAEKDSLEITTAQCWGNTTFTGMILNRTMPFKLAPGEQVLASMHFEPSTPDSEQHPQTGQMTHFYYDEFVLATDATLGVKFQSNATASGIHPSRNARADQPTVDVVHPDPNGTESAGRGSTYHIEWSMTNVPSVNIDYSYHNSAGIPTWQPIIQNLAETSYDWKVPDTLGVIDIRVTPVDQPIFTKISSLTVSSSAAGVTPVTAEPSVQIYPNPVARTLRLAGLHGDVVTLLDLMGRTVLQTKAVGGKATFDCTALPLGNYILRIGSGVWPITIAR